MRNAFVGVAITCVLNVLFVSVLDLNIYALALNTLIFSGLLMVLNMRAAMRLCKVRVNFLRMALIPLVCGGLMAVACVIFYNLVYYLLDSNTIATVVGVGIGAVVYFVLMVNTGGITETEMENLPMGRYLWILKIR